MIEKKKIRAAAEASTHKLIWNEWHIAVHILFSQIKKMNKSIKEKEKWANQNELNDSNEFVYGCLLYWTPTEMTKKRSKKVTYETTSKRRRKSKRENLHFRMKLSKMCFILFICLLLAFSVIFWAKKNFDWYTTVYSNSNSALDKTIDVAVKHSNRKKIGWANSSLDWNTDKMKTFFRINEFRL